MSVHTNMSAGAGGKDVIYVDIDEEITGIIDKVRSSSQRIVALVLPKRATVMQSIVNMKLLKRTADEAKKHVVLITAEAGLLPLAGNVGLYVARNLQTKPEIPSGPADAVDESTEDIDEPAAIAAGAAALSGAQHGTTSEPHLDRAKPIGQFPGASSIAAGTDLPDEDETIELDDEPEPSQDPGTAAAKASKKLKGFKIPDFNKFRLFLFLSGAGLVLLIVMLYLAFAVMPKATVAIKTDSTAVPTTATVTLASVTSPTDLTLGVVPSDTQETTKTLTQQADASGEIDKGTKATGQVKISLNDCVKEQVTIPAGTAVSANSLTFITQQSVTVYSVKIGPNCRNSDFPSNSTATVDVVAQQGGEKYNVEAQAYKIAVSGNVSGQGTAMSGGTTNVVKVVAQADIDNATQKIGQQDTSAVKQELIKALQAKGLYPIAETFKAGDPETTTSAKAGDEAANVAVTQKIKYSMRGVKQDTIKNILKNEVADKIDSCKQSILDYGFSTISFTQQSENSSGVIVSMSSRVTVGSDLNVATIKKQVAGKKANDARDIIKAYPGVTEVDVTYSPFWVSSIPKKTAKITVTVQEPRVSASNASSN